MACELARLERIARILVAALLPAIRLVIAARAIDGCANLGPMRSVIWIEPDNLCGCGFGAARRHVHATVDEKEARVAVGIQRREFTPFALYRIVGREDGARIVGGEV